MTCIVGFVEGASVWMGGDSAGTNGWLDQDLYASPKVFRNGAMLIGSCGSARQAQLLRWSLDVPDHDPRSDIEKYMVRSFIDAVRACFTSGGVRKKDSEVETSLGHFLVGYRGRLFVVYDDFQVRMPALPYAAVGCGDQIALGAMYASGHVTDPRERVEQALRASERFSAGVRGPFHIEVLEAAQASASVAEQPAFPANRTIREGEVPSL
jgi:ATP-dependent protease HslVU (ClpYQ) peptidase subunit